jgi:hypothetical protein
MITDVGAVALFIYFPVLYFYSKNLACWLERADHVPVWYTSMCHVYELIMLLMKLLIRFCQ